MKTIMGKSALMAGILALTIAIPAANAASDKTDKAEIYRLLELFGDVFERVRSDYVEEVTDETLIEAAIQGMLRSLDPHSSYLNKKTFKDMRVQTKGEFGGLGIEVTMEGGYVKVVSPIDDTPAHRAGLEPGDLISRIDNTEVQGLTLSEAVEKMRGRIGTDILLTILRKNVEPFDVTITRDKIRIRSVRSRVEGEIGYVRITSFTEQTTSGLKDAFAKLDKKIGADKIRGYVIDLRNNPGGLLDQAVSVSDMFLERGEVVSTRGRAEGNAQRFHARPGDLADGLPIVVLINGGSASASEIVAGALQDHRRAIILGTKSFGKGSVQTIIPLGRNGAMKLTTQRYYTPSGRSIQAKGIEPDILVEPSKVEPLARRRSRSEKDLRGSLKNNQSGKRAPDGGGKTEKAKNAAPDTSRPLDYQLVRALALLRGISLYREQTAN
ncbi:MAG: putative CtpA-like serine protease [Alphaproteobacteria bacterium MarineAlpha10_Bin3]|nr:MAG: putative CtpA-like serine protease [Alphaproteobacteria bacterium MarineAlpha10_Bin3]PPR69215.1 MAG: putative CtpA-like serine protease [Alphaproteobacteria bacterium MarineAlpha4_Bin1]